MSDSQQQNKHPAPKTKYDFLIGDDPIWNIRAGEFKLAARAAQRKGIKFETILVDEFQVKLSAIGQALSKYFDVPYQPFEWHRAPPMELLKNLKREFLESQQWVPMDSTNEDLIVLCTDPERVKRSRILSDIFPKLKPAFRVTTLKEFQDTLEHFYFDRDKDEDKDELDSFYDKGEVNAGAASVDDSAASEEYATAKLVNTMIVEAFKQGASVIHVEEYPNVEGWRRARRTDIRFRKDGELVRYNRVPSLHRSAFVARLKIMCGVNPSEKRKPQAGKITFRRFGPLDIDLRVQTLPTAGGGENVIMRLVFKRDKEPVALERLGMSPSNLPKLKQAISVPYGLILVCGWPESGRTLTLNSILGYLNTEDRKVLTVEDSIEFIHPGARQVEIEKKAALDFPTALNAIFKSDPDIVLIDELRDQDMMHIAIDQSLAGHLVLAAARAKSAAESIIQMLDMGMDRFNVADALVGVVAQCLVRRLCTKCRETHVANPDQLKSLLDEYCRELLNTAAFRKDPVTASESVYHEWLKTYGNQSGQLTLRTAHGCEACGNTGYRGRVALHELLPVSDSMKKFIRQRAPASELVAGAIGEGMRTLKMDGIEKVLWGVADIQQVRAVCG